MAVGTFLRMLETYKTNLKWARNFALKRLICVNVRVVAKALVNRSTASNTVSSSSS